MTHDDDSGDTKSLTSADFRGWNWTGRTGSSSLNAPVNIQWLKWHEVLLREGGYYPERTHRAKLTVSPLYSLCAKLSAQWVMTAEEGNSTAAGSSGRLLWIQTSRKSIKTSLNVEKNSWIQGWHQFKTSLKPGRVWTAFVCPAEGSVTIFELLRERLRLELLS